jgi:DNA-binding XRE family transcriptional regulator
VTGAHLQRVRQRLERSRADVGAGMGISRQAIAYLERQESVQPETAARFLSAVFGLPVELAMTWRIMPADDRKPIQVAGHRRIVRAGSVLAEGESDALSRMV